MEGKWSVGKVQGRFGGKREWTEGSGQGTETSGSKPRNSPECGHILTPPDPTTHSSHDLDSLVDITADIPEEIWKHTLDLIRRHIKAFRFDNCLGTLKSKASIHLKEGVHLISGPMYGASPAK